MNARLVLALDDDTLDALAELLVPRLRDRLAGDDAPEPIAYTIATLATSVGVSEKVVRGAIHRGELTATRRGSRYLISPAAARQWAGPADPATRTSRGLRKPAGGRPLREALDRFGDAA
jgi:excisionase family DNA binding protein